MFLHNLTKLYRGRFLLYNLLKGYTTMKLFSFFTNFFGDTKINVDTTRRVLFVLKQRQNYEEQDKSVQHFAKSLVTGMYNSVTFISEMLNSIGVTAKVVIVVDNNSIDREVSIFKPTDVFIEGMWVVSEKFDILKKLHPKINWVVRCHSEIPFLSGEGNAIERAFGYVKRGVALSGNSYRVGNTFKSIIGGALLFNKANRDKLFPVLPNYYPVVEYKEKQNKKYKQVLDIGCFGAIRPLKNQLIQAIAAIELAKTLGKPLNFHINIGRVEGNATSQLKNIRSLFYNLDNNYNLIEHSWIEHEEFCDLLEKMDLCMQVSFSETFNIVTADAVVRNVPVVVSSEILWTNHFCWAETTSVEDIVEVGLLVLNNKRICRENKSSLKNYSEDTKKVWMKYFAK